MHRLQPTPYHRAIVAYLRAHEADLWNWFGSGQAQADYAESLRLELLKRCYRLHADSHPELAQAGLEATQRLGLEIPVTFYQAQERTELNAALYYLRGEGHVVFSGPVLSLLTSTELKAVIGHELAHYFLWQEEEGAHLVADRVLQAMANHPDAAPSHLQTARRFRLHTEIYADRGAWLVTPDLNAVVASLVKMQTGLHQASGSSYLAQAEEIFSRGHFATEQVSHPEAFIRARALRLWSEGAAELDGELSAMIHGEETLDSLDLPGQAGLSGLTRRFIEQLLRPAWFQTDAALGHARLFFPRLRPAHEDDPALEQELTALPPKLREYLAFVLLDFCVADPELERMPVAWALEWARRFKFEAEFEKMLVRELKLSARELKKIRSEAAEGAQLAEAGA